MILDQNLMFFLFFINFFLICFVGVFAYYTYYKRLVDLKKVQLDSLESSKKIMDDAGKRSLEVIEKTEQKADEILTHSQLFKSDLNKGFNESLKQMADKYIEMIQGHSKKFEEDYSNLLTSVKDQSLRQSQEALSSINNEIKKQLDESKSLIKDEIMKSLEKTKQEISQYKSAEMAKVDEEIDKLVIDMAKDLLRINLTPKDHKKLVMQSLDKAKEQGAFFL